MLSNTTWRKFGIISEIENFPTGRDKIVIMAALIVFFALFFRNRCDIPKK